MRVTIVKLKMSKENSKTNSHDLLITGLNFYSEYHGHLISQLEMCLQRFRVSGEHRHAVYLAGDSTLDNKYWLSSSWKEPLNGYENIIQAMKPDVAYWINESCEKERKEFFCINAACEESTISDRTGSSSSAMLKHDIFIRDNLREDDVLIISVGGNDIGHRPTMCTVVKMALLMSHPKSMISNGSALGLGHFKNMWKNQTEQYIEKLCAKKKPKLVIVCMLYFLDEKPGDSWADGVLRLLGYNSDPTKLQLVIRKLYEECTCKIQIEGTTVVPMPLFEILDGKTTSDYCERVEPSTEGGRKMGRALYEKIKEYYPLET